MAITALICMQGQVDRYFIFPTASVTIVNGDFIDTPDDGQGESRSNTATVSVYMNVCTLL